MIGGLPVDEDGKLRVEEDAPVEWVAGWPITAAGAIAVTVDAETVGFDGGLPRDTATGAVAVHDDTGTWDGGALRHTDGALCVNLGGDIAGRVAGWPVDEDDRLVCVLEGAEFPSIATVLDDFNRANENPVGAPWDGGVSGAGASLLVASNEAANTLATTGARLDGPFGPDIELQVQVTTPGDNGISGVALTARIADGGTAGWDGYRLVWTHADPQDVWALQRVDDGSITLLDGTSVQSDPLEAGDRIGLQIVGSTLKGYKFTGGAWAEVISRTDATYDAAGSLGVQIIDESQESRIDNVIGGTA